MKYYSKKIKYRFLLSAALLIFFFGISMSYTQYSLISEHEHHETALQDDNIKRIYSFMLKELKNDLIMHSNVILLNSSIHTAVEKLDRPGLKKLTKPILAMLQKDNPFLKIMTFRTKDGTALLRLHKPEMFGDSLHPDRKIIHATNKSHTLHTGFEVGKLNMTYRVIQPIFSNKKYVGSLELGVEPEYITSSLRSITNLQNALLVKADHTATSLELKVMGMIKDFYLLRSDPFFVKNFDKIDLDKEKLQLTYEGNRYTLRSDLELKDYQGLVIAKILLAYDIQSLTTHTQKLLTFTLVLTAFLTALLLILLHYGFNFFIRKISYSQDELNLYKERMELAFEGSNDGLFDWDLVNDTIYFSPRWKEMLGYQKDELQDHLNTLKSFLHPDDLQATLDELKACIDQKKPLYENIHRLRHKSGSWVWILARGKVQYDTSNKPIRFIGTHTDVTKEKEFAKQTLEMNKQLEIKVKERTAEQGVLLSLFDSGSSVLFKWNNDANRSVDYVSESMTNFLEYDIKDFLNNKHSYTSCVYPSDLKKVLDVIDDAIKKNKDHFHHEPYRVLTKSGLIKWVYDYTVVVRNSRNEITSFVGYMADITALKEKEDTLIQQSRLAQMGEMISMIAHQWRQPLTSISAISLEMKLQLLLDKYDFTQEEERKACQSNFIERIQKIGDLIQSLTETIDDFRNFYKSDKKRMHLRIDIPVTKALDIIKPSFLNHKIEVKTDFKSQSTLPLINSELMQVILNILKNAQDKFLEQNTSSPTILIVTKDTDDGILLEISDNGAGISQDIMQKMFDPYFSTKNEKNGTGLGLYMSKIIIEDHHKGKFNAQNLENGVCFSIHLYRQALIALS